MSYKVEVIADNSGKWTGNAMRYATYKEADRSARMLSQRWTLVQSIRVVESDDPVNAICDRDGKHDLLPEIMKELNDDDQA